ncbi:MAG: trypsin-like peptidase domain-containing protein [Erysipelotrichaceae bacterium]|nr:trypsin-like peptidase domain-containing protein [Erysipelotrichaceae bacterium]
MKMNFKNIIIIFLVALLGSGLGTFGVMSLYNKDHGGSLNNNVVVNEVEYTNVEKTDYTKAIEKAYETVVEITCQIKTSSSGSFFFFEGGGSTSTSAGSGVIFSSDGYIVTNEHVIDGLVSEDTITVKTYNGTTYGAKVVGYDTKTDLAVLKIEAKGLPYASFADSSQLMLGQDVIAIGNPLGLGLSCSNGIVSALEKEIYINNVYMTVIQTNAAVNEGNSGGGLFDINGNLVGIVNAKKSSTMSTTSVEGMGYAIPANTVTRIINELITNGYVKDRATMGVKVATNSSYYTTDGVLITEVIEGGSAQAAGLQANDIITAINDVEVQSYADLSKVLDSKMVGDTVAVSVLRDGEKMVFEVTLSAASR